MFQAVADLVVYRRDGLAPGQTLAEAAHRLVMDVTKAFALLGWGFNLIAGAHLE